MPCWADEKCENTWEPYVFLMEDFKDYVEEGQQPKRKSSIARIELTPALHEISLTSLYTLLLLESQPLSSLVLHQPLSQNSPAFP
ncbi:hypothetical protein Acr_27g0009660 [Actinidia rufa]|uniref:Uncharacterized protein n=1 Tax=Actinidia rufa TaxID=165716 RepID=A0A7J0H7Z0_9ERIC|nr:hypothetical protein Acr_27g0009660 [Actinidia rufa]